MCVCVCVCVCMWGGGGLGGSGFFRKKASIEKLKEDYPI